MSTPSEAFHGGRAVPAEELRRQWSGVRADAQVLGVASAAATTAYGGVLRIPVHPLAGSVSVMAVSFKLEAGERTRGIVLPISECWLAVAQGQGLICIAQKEYDLTIGDVAFVPVSAEFSIENVGGDPVVLLGLISPPDVNMLRVAGLWRD